MKLKLTIIGLVIAIFSVIGYVYTPIAISQMIHSMIGMTGSSSSSSPINTSSMLHSMGYPSRTLVIPVLQYSFVGLGIIGIVLIGYGFVSKNYKKQFVVEETQDKEPRTEKSSTNSQSENENSLTNYKAMKRLQERLANGEITASEFERTKKLLE